VIIEAAILGGVASLLGTYRFARWVVERFPPPPTPIEEKRRILERRRTQLLAGLQPLLKRKDQTEANAISREIGDIDGKLLKLADDE
jgi:hypothetical protein